MMFSRWFLIAVGWGTVRCRVVGLDLHFDVRSLPEFYFVAVLICQFVRNPKLTIEFVGSLYGDLCFFRLT